MIDSDSGKPVGEVSILLNAAASESAVMAASAGNGTDTYLLNLRTDAAAVVEKIGFSVPDSTTKLKWVLTDISVKN